MCVVYVCVRVSVCMHVSLCMHVVYLYCLLLTLTFAPKRVAGETSSVAHPVAIQPTDRSYETKTPRFAVLRDCPVAMTSCAILRDRLEQFGTQKRMRPRTEGGGNVTSRFRSLDSASRVEGRVAACDFSADS